jgi:hypothetical protein
VTIHCRPKNFKCYLRSISSKQLKTSPNTPKSLQNNFQKKKIQAKRRSTDTVIKASAIPSRITTSETVNSRATHKMPRTDQIQGGAISSPQASYSYQEMPKRISSARRRKPTSCNCATCIDPRTWRAPFLASSVTFQQQKNGECEAGDFTCVREGCIS